MILLLIDYGSILTWSGELTAALFGVVAVGFFLSRVI
jgi:hypothetical protein